MADVTDTQATPVISTGLPGLDQVLDGLRIGDNVVWRVTDLDDYRRFVTPFVASATAAGRQIIYLRFGQHEPLLAPAPGIRIIEVDARDGFESFTARIWELVETWGRGAFYVCDCLSDLLNAWATDTMVGYFFRVICPFLFELDTVAWFALLPQRHSRQTLDRIRATTQVMIDVHRADDDMQLQPVKVWQRQSPTMFLPHRYRDGEFIPVTDSSNATRLQAAIEQQAHASQQLLDGWDRLFLEAEECEAPDSDRARALVQRILQVLVSRDPRILALAEDYLSLDDLTGIHNRTIGSGYIGGKAVGMLLARAILTREDPDTWGSALDPHDSMFLASDVWYAFLVHNGLWPAIMKHRTREGFFDEAPALREAILQGEFPPEVRPELIRTLDHFGQYPILVRSSSLLEDGFGNAFAGKYESVFLINQGDPEQRLAALENAIRQVYASTMSEDALSYRRGRDLEDLEEPMALLIQRVNGRFHDHWYLPDAAAVGVSRNTFVWAPDMDPKAGMLRLVMGLGTRAVDRIQGDHAWVIALDQPLKQPFRNLEENYRFSQHLVDTLDVTGPGLTTTDLTTLVREAPSLPLERLGETDRAASQRARELGLDAPVWRLTFRPLIRQGEFIELAGRMLKTLERAYQHPVDVEFTVHLDNSEVPVRLNLVQCRPLATIGDSQPASLPERPDPRRLLMASEGRFMGGNINLAIHRIILVRAAEYSALDLNGKHQVAKLVGRLARQTPEHFNLMLAGPGRWGTSSPELGVPVGFADISRVSLLVEIADMGNGMVPDLSFGSHFFQDLVESGIAYVAIFPDQQDSTWNPDWLKHHAQQRHIDSLLQQDLPPAAIQDCVTVLECEGSPLRVLADVTRQRLVAGHF
ncbi:PEP/pyruvate-binding domain-containing protein [Marinobacter bryozoorum]|uniref:PEP/pyruvate-binding domain-containing protein n=1 Tax=Marinobacter bryozoorum TaxID=256324 RepID=UPI002006B5B3|nr:PEP/pyruvate-binding domain-containing protein [Marinobacter bryozoorum]MCK7542614.1 PEP/pyruvate-binding domain-containing protein [Marinobacter bryozoorum]